MKFCGKISIITQGNAPLYTSPLSYLVQADADHTKEYESNIKSAKQWAVGWGEKEVEVHRFDNLPTHGFKIGKVASRYSTSNKFYRIIDPRGFQLEISTDNLNEIIQNGEIVYGEIIGKYVWVKSTRDYLISVNHPEYKRWLNPPEKEKNKSLDIGDLVILPNDGEALYIGKKYMLEGYLDSIANPDYRYNWSSSQPNHPAPYYLYNIRLKQPEKPVHVFLTAYGTTSRSTLANFKLISQSQSKHLNVIMSRKNDYTNPYNTDSRCFYDTKEERDNDRSKFLERYHKEMVLRYGVAAVRDIEV